MKSTHWNAALVVTSLLIAGCASERSPAGVLDDVAVYTAMPDGAVAITDIAASGSAIAKDGEVPDNILVLLKRQASVLGGDAVVINGSIVVGDSNAVASTDAGNRLMTSKPVFQVVGATVVRTSHAQ